MKYRLRQISETEFYSESFFLFYFFIFFFLWCFERLSIFCMYRKKELLKNC